MTLTIQVRSLYRLLTTGGKKEAEDIQTSIDPLNEEMWAICKACGEHGLMHYWLTYVRKYPERCVKEN